MVEIMSAGVFMIIYTFWYTFPTAWSFWEKETTQMQDEMEQAYYHVNRAILSNIYDQHKWKLNNPLILNYDPSNIIALQDATVR